MTHTSTLRYSVASRCLDLVRSTLRESLEPTRAKPSFETCARTHVSG